MTPAAVAPGNTPAFPHFLMSLGGHGPFELMPTPIQPIKRKHPGPRPA